MWKKVRRPQEEKSRYIKRLKKCWIYKENQDMKKLVSTDFSAENWLILGKKWSMMIATADKYGCRTLPMRNWHCKFFKNIFSFCHFCRTLPMRNWHFYTLFQGTPVYQWVGHYLWGIDTCLPLINPTTFFIIMLSDITYEELTHEKNSWSPYGWILSDITYEELTHSCLIKRIISQASESDITYEELTLFLKYL